MVSLLHSTEMPRNDIGFILSDIYKLVQGHRVVSVHVIDQRTYSCSQFDLFCFEPYRFGDWGLRVPRIVK